MWGGSLRAAEIIRYTYGGWNPRTSKVQGHARHSMSPACHRLRREREQRASMADALINIGVFNDDRAIRQRCRCQAAERRRTSISAATARRR